MVFLGNLHAALHWGSSQGSALPFFRLPSGNDVGHLRCTGIGSVLITTDCSCQSLLVSNALAPACKPTLCSVRIHFDSPAGHR
jgi:hypothetical protein